MVEPQMLEFLISIYVAQLLLDVFLAYVLYSFYRSYGRRYLLPWALSWAALAVRHMAGFQTLWYATELPPASPVRLLVTSVTIAAALLQGTWLLEGTYGLQTGGVLSSRLRRALPLSGITAGLAIAFLSTPLPPVWRIGLRMGFPSLVLGIAFISAAVWLMMRGGWKREFGRRIICVAFLLYGCLRLLTPLLSLSTSYESLRSFWGFFSTRMHDLELFEFFLHSMIGLGMVIWLLEAERKKLSEAEERTRQSQKLEALGRLAGGIAHDFNNILTVILGYSDLLIARADKDEAVKEAQEIHRAAERGSSLTTQLLALSRKQVLTLEVVDVNAVISGMEQMLRRRIPENIRLDLRLDPAIHKVRADSSQLTQVVLDLALNARDAMPSGGTLTLSTTNVVVDRSRHPGQTFLEPGRYARLVIEDTGVGMDDETKSHIFEPFFSTKKPGEGTGLGLATAYGIVMQANGYLTLDSRPGRGTRFDVYLPASDG